MFECANILDATSNKAQLQECMVDFISKTTPSNPIQLIRAPSIPDKHRKKKFAAKNSLQDRDQNLPCKTDHSLHFILQHEARRGFFSFFFFFPLLAYPEERMW